MSTPNFLIIGAAKAGTTSLYAYLKSHPQVFMPTLKEPQFFLCDEASTRAHLAASTGWVNLNSLVDEWEEYSRLFEDSKGFAAIGEASPGYLYDPAACERIFRRLPDARVIAILRDPVDRAHSHYQRSFELGSEPCLTFEDAVSHEQITDSVHQGSRHYLRMGFYGRQLSRYFEVFGKSHVHVCLYDELRTDPAGLMAGVCDFLGIDPIAPEVKVQGAHNRTAHPHSRWLHRILSNTSGTKRTIQRVLPHGMLARARRLTGGLRRWNTGGRVRLSQETRGRLEKVFRRDLETLEELIQRDLTRWRASAQVQA